MGYTFRLAATCLLYVPPNRHDNTYHDLCDTSRGTMVGTRNSSLVRRIYPSHHERTFYHGDIPQSLDIFECKNHSKLVLDTTIITKLDDIPRTFSWKTAECAMESSCIAGRKYVKNLKSALYDTFVQSGMVMGMGIRFPKITVVPCTKWPL